MKSLVRYERKLIFVKDIDTDPARQFNVSQVKQEFTPGIISRTFVAKIGHNFGQFKIPTDDLILATEILELTDDWARGKEKNEPKCRDIKNVFSRGTSKVILKEDITFDANVLPGGLDLAVKSTIAGKTK